MNKPIITFAENRQKMTAQELRLEEYQKGKTIIDFYGNRVRIEEYIVRPANDTFKLVLLNSRKGRVDYYTETQAYNKTLPADLSLIGVNLVLHTGGRGGGGQRCVVI